ncbi:MAG: hypothetical protein J5726_00550 [Treponema sp.]|nr:hypothetical protein [Treponema sp.]
MTRKSSLLFVIFLIFSCSLWAASSSQTEWTLGAQKFSFTRNQSDSVSEGVAQMFPARILEKLSSGLYRNVTEDERLERELYTIKQDNKSLFLQLSAEVKRRDSLVTQNYSARELEKKIAEEDKKIKDIKDKLAANLEKQKKAAEQNEVQAASVATGASVSEKIVLYKKDISSLFTPSKDAQLLGLTSSLFEEEVLKANINCLITGSITAFDEYMSLTVYAHVFPGAKQIAVITEVGSLDDADLMAASIASKLTPELAAAMPCTIKINIEPQQALEVQKTYIDDILINNLDSEFTIDSGVHFIQFTAEGYKNAGTSYYFEGGQSYLITVNLVKTEETTIYLGSHKELGGSFLINGSSAQALTDGKGRIVINGNAVLGEFITEDKNTAYFYIPENKIIEDGLYTAKLKTVNHTDFIEKRRREMYLSYSILVTSLIPTIICSGTVKSYKAILADPQKQKKIDNLNEKISTANKWVLASNISSGISIACAVWFAFELYRYFTAANSVLPVSTSLQTNYIPAPVKEEQPPQAADQTEQAEQADQTAQTEEAEQADEPLLIEE